MIILRVLAGILAALFVFLGLASLAPFMRDFGAYVLELVVMLVLALAVMLAFVLLCEFALGML